MKLSTVLFLVVLVMLPAWAFSGEISEVELKDGSIVRGEVLSLNDLHCTLRSDSLGTVDIERSRIRAIRMKGSQEAPTASSGGTQGLIKDQVAALQEHMVSDQSSLDSITALQDDPDVREVLEDPDLMKAVASGDMAALSANPKFMKLLEKPGLQNIGKGTLQK
ncbi:MAG TPA: hypothetical protein DCZ69_09260 [Syntrophobacteraceae bacterium]|nr:hypothetical protein [Syntrophobacteraceae bacterium]